MNADSGKLILLAAMVGVALAGNMSDSSRTALVRGSVALTGGADARGSGTSGARDYLAAAGAPAPSPFYRVGAELPPAVTAQSALIADLETREEYFALKPDLRWPIASLTKLLTAAFVMDRMALAEMFSIAQEDFRTPENEVTLNLKVGSRYGGTDLLRALLVISSNEAAEAFARAYGRGEFIAGMNALAASWGLTHTSVLDPTGLSPANQATVRDLTFLAARLRDFYPSVFETTRLPAVTITDLNSGRRDTIRNINLLVTRDDFLGGKTGYTEDAGGNLLTVFSYGGRSVAAVILGSEDRFADSEVLINWFKHGFRSSR